MKQIIFSLYSLLSLLFIASCSSHEDPWYGNTRVGSILLSENVSISPDRFDGNTMTAIGVVIGTRHDSIWVVSMKDMGQEAYLDTLAKVDAVSSSLSSLNGRENTAALLQSDFRSAAATVASNYSAAVKGWSLPSVGELRMLSSALPIVERSMAIAGGDPFLSYPYLSSTQDGSSEETEEIYACCVTLQTGYVSSMMKTSKALVRPVLRLKAQ